jgi:DNA-binding response OmpR family regulator
MDKILVADLPSMDARYSAAFTGWPLVFVRSMEEASAALEAPHYDAIAIGVYFDDSQMFDLVRAIRSHEVHNEVPVLCVRGGPGFAAVTTRTLEIAVQALSADCFVDLLQFQDEKSGEAALRAALQRYVKT